MTYDLVLHPKEHSSCVWLGKKDTKQLKQLHMTPEMKNTGMHIFEMF